MSYILKAVTLSLFFTPLKLLALDIAIPDNAFQLCIKEQSEKHNWQSVTEIKKIKCHGRGIRSISGIEQLSELERLSLYKNEITDIKVKLPASLVVLNLAGNPLKKLKLTNLIHLQKLYLFKTNLTSLSLSQLPELIEFKANNGKLVELSMEGVNKLKKIYLFDNNLKDIPLKPLVGIEYMDLRHNPMPDEFYDILDKMEGVTVLHDGNADDW